jgi:hypothetical protein
MTLAWLFFFFHAVTTTAPSASKRDSSILASEGAIVVKKGTLVSQERTTNVENGGVGAEARYRQGSLVPGLATLACSGRPE